MRQELVRASAEDIEKYLEVLRNSKPSALRDSEIKYISMSDNEIYYHFMDHPVTDHGTFQVIVHESGEVPRLFVKTTKKGKKFISQGVQLRELKK